MGKRQWTPFLADKTAGFGGQGPYVPPEEQAISDRLDNKRLTTNHRQSNSHRL